MNAAGCLELIVGIDTFLEIADIASLGEDEIKSLFIKGKFIENFCEKLITSDEQYRFERILKEYAIEKVKNVRPFLYYRNFSNEIFIKIFSANLSQNLTLLVFKEFVELFGKERLKSVIDLTAQTRAVYIKLTQAVDSTEYLASLESIFLAKSWNRYINSDNDGKLVVKQRIQLMCSEPSSINLLLSILCLEDVDKEFYSLKQFIFKELYTKLESNIQYETWNSIFSSKFYVMITEIYSPLLELSLKVLQLFSIKLSFDKATNKWRNSCPSEFDYSDIVNILKLMYNLPCLNSRMREFIDFNKINYEESLWLNIEKDIEQSMI